MTNREKVINGLEAIVNDDWIWKNAGYCAGICKDALALLKTLEARLLTYEDFHSGREDGGEAIPCWKETRSKTRRSGWAVIVYGKMLADRETGVARYWTAKPTEEQMQEEAWPGA